VTKKTRNRCQACRLRKCFESGMNPKLIRQINNQRIIHTNITDENYFGLSQVNLKIYHYLLTFLEFFFSVNL